MRRQWIGPVGFAGHPDAGQPWEHKVIYEEDGDYYTTTWLGPREVRHYPVDGLTGGVLIPVTEYTLPYEEGWKIAPQSEIVDTAHTFIKKPLLIFWTPKAPGMLSNALRGEIRALETCKNLVVAGLGHYKGVVVKDGLVTGIAWQRYLCDIGDPLWHDHNNPQLDDLRYYTPAEALRQISQAVEALHSVDIVHGDIHHSNVFLDSDRRAWLIDFDSASKIGEDCPKKRSHFQDARKFSSFRTYIDLYCLTKLEDDLIRFRTLAFEHGFTNDIEDARPCEPYEDSRYEPVSHFSQVHWRSTTAPALQFKLLVLLLDKPIENVLKQHGDWHDIVASWFRRTIVTLPDNIGDFVLTIKSYDAFGEHLELPDKADFETADGLLLVGYDLSPASQKQTLQLVHELIRSVYSSSSSSKLLALGAGHTILAKALGGELAKEPSDCPPIVRPLQIEEAFKRLLAGQNSSDAGLEDTIALHILEPGSVSKMPPGFTELCKLDNHSVRGIMSPTVERLDEVRIISLAGHPEFSVHNNIPLQYIEHLKAQGKLSEEGAVQASEKACLPNDGIAFGRLLLDWLTKGFTEGI